MNEKQYNLFLVHLRAIIASIIGLTLSVISVSFIYAGDSQISFVLFICSIIFCWYAFATPFIYS